MAVFIVTYDLNKEVTRPKILEKIREWPWAKLSESSYAVEATSLEAVYNQLKPLIDNNDNLFVITLKQPYRGWGPKVVHEWLENRLTY